MFKALGHWLKQIFGSSQPDQPRMASLPQSESNSQMAVQFDSIDAAGHLVPYDENLLERARTQWQFGDWQSLANLDRDTLQHHPDRAKLVLLAAAGRLQIGQDSEARQYIRLAQDWGCSKKHISQVLISGVHNSIGIAAAVGAHQQRAALHFEKAISIGSPSSDIQLMTQARTAHQVGDFDQMGWPIQTPVGYLVTTNRITKSEIFNLKTHSKDQVELNSQKEQKLAQLERPIKTSQQSKNDPKANNKTSPNITVKKTSSNADIDDMLADIRPFFAGKQITYVDIGAYVGEVFLKIIESKAIRIREAHLYEPNPKSFHKLKENIKDCKVNALHSYNFAISWQAGEQEFIEAGSMTKMTSLQLDATQATGVFNVKTYSLDDMASTFTDSRIDFLKIDVEGSELKVLEGAKKLLQNQQIDIIYIEAGLNRDGTQQTYLGSIDVLLQESGYRIFKIYEQKNEWMDDSPLLRRCNCIYMSAEFANVNPYKKTIEVDNLKKEIFNLKQQLSGQTTGKEQ
jgi:FkbM family methyltransferase